MPYGFTPEGESELIRAVVTRALRGKSATMIYFACRDFPTWACDGSLATIGVVTSERLQVIGDVST